MRRILVLTAIVLPLPAFAHVGHLGELAGHSHWIALGALGIATAIGGLAAAKRKDKDAAAQDSTPSGDASDAPEARA